MSFTTVPSCINRSDLPNLTHLKLKVWDLDEQGLKSLGALPELRHLNLWTSSTATITVTDGFFRKLRWLSLYRSMVLFVLNEDSSISFTIWGDPEDDVVAFGSQKGIVRAPAVMPNLQMLEFLVDVRALIRNNGSCDKLGLEYLPLLREVKVELLCRGAFADDVERQEAALRHAIEAHPNGPALQIQFYRKDKMKSRPVDDDLATHDVTGGEEDDMLW
jgi:disease resistance protein RPM1